MVLVEDEIVDDFLAELDLLKIKLTFLVIKSHFFFLNFNDK